MAKDEETGIDPKATDGEPHDGFDGDAGGGDEVARRRAAKTGGKGGSAKDRGQEELDTGDEQVQEEDDGQLFVWEQGRKVTLGTLIDRKTPVEHAFVFTGKRVKGRGGLMALDQRALLLVRTLSGPVKVVPTHDADEKVTSAVIESHVNTKVVLPANSEEAIDMLRPVLAEAGYDIVKQQTTAAV